MSLYLVSRDVCLCVLSLYRITVHNSHEVCVGLGSETSCERHSVHNDYKLGKWECVNFTEPKTFYTWNLNHMHS